MNIILKREFDGFETRARIGGTSDGGAGERLLSQTGGFAWPGGHLVASYEFHQRDELRAGDRRATADADLRPLGGSDWREFYAAPGNIMYYDPVSGSFDPIFAIPRGQDGTALTPGDFLPGEVNLANQNEGRWSLPRQTRHSLFAAGRQALPSGFSLDADVRYTDRRYRLDTIADIGVLFVTPDNPWFVSPDGAPFHEIAYSYINDLGIGLDEGRSRSLGGAIGLEGPVAGWTVAAYVSGGREENENTASNRANVLFVNEALGSTPDNPATPFNTATDGFFNPYGDPGANSAAILDFIGSGYTHSRNTSSVVSANLKADRSLMDLPGGPLRMALGLDVRRERFGVGGENFISTAAPRPVTPAVYERDVSAAFIELRAPFVGADNARPGLERLELSLAARTEHHDGVGDTTNPKVGLLYSPTPDLLLRASWGTSFRAPSLRELYSAYLLGPAFLSRGSSNIIAIVQYGGNPALRPETAESVTAGFVWTPAAVEGLRVEGSWFRTRFTDRIGQPVSENLVQALNDPTLSPFVRYVSPGTSAADLALVQSLIDEPGNYMPGAFPATAYGAVVDSRYVNAAEVFVEPPFYDAPRGIAYDAANTNVLGRQLSLQLVKRW